MKENFLNLTFIIDESGSMSSSRHDIIGGFNTFIEDQKKEIKGDVNVSLYTFSDDVKRVLVNRNIIDVENLSESNYSPGGMTSLNDAVGTAINEIGHELSKMPEEERPSTVMFVIMTDGFENSSKEFSSSQIRDMIKHQTDKYNWKFVYLGTDITTTQMADDLGISCRGFSSRKDVGTTMARMSQTALNYRSMSTVEADAVLSNNLNSMTAKYESDLGIKIK